MATKTQGNNNSSDKFFQVGAVDVSEQLKNILEVTLSASLLSVLNAMVISKPGTGKTSLLSAMAKQVFGENGYLPMYCSPTMRPEEWIGYQNPAYIINRKQAIANKEAGWIIENTPFDPNYALMCLFEHSRIGEMADDVSLAAFDYGSDGYVNRKTQDAVKTLGGAWYPHVAWSDSNFLNPSERNEARRDRFPLMVYYSLPSVDIEALMSKNEIKYWTFNMPNWEDIQEVRGWMFKWLEAPAGTKQLKLIANALEPIQEVAQAKNFVINNRRIRQWQRLMFAVSAYAAGTANFKEISRSAWEAMAYCYPTESIEQMLEWRGIVLAGVDATETAISQIEGDAYMQYQEVFYGKDGHGGIKEERNPANRTQRINAELGTVLGKYQKELRNRFPGDQRAIAAEGRLYTLFMKALKGEDI